MARIIKEGGKVAKCKSVLGKETGPMRIYNKKLLCPGLAMSRSIGDQYAHTLGCSSEADITHRILKPCDKIIIIASDGVWEYMSNTEVANIVY